MNHHPEPVVTTAQGAVRGLRQDGIAAFLNIPYATPPRGASRFAPPQPHEPWDGMRDATVLGPNAPQSERKLGRVDMSPYFGTGWSRGEDYLTVNVFTPAAGGDLPVMVFVHGGGFVAGSTRSTMYDGSAFARDGVVLVTLNYRLGIAGFLDLPGAPANRGLLDVVAALRWVRENIAAFGGDPHNVTLLGQSAGATIVGGVLATPEATGLIRRAIVQSGSGLGAFTTEQAARVTQAAAEALGIEPHVDAFADISDDRLVEAASRFAGIDLQTDTHHDPLIGLSPFSLVLDTQPAESVAAGLSADVDLLIGTNTEEETSTWSPWTSTPPRPPQTSTTRRHARTRRRGSSSRRTARPAPRRPSASCAPPSWATRCSARAAGHWPAHMPPTPSPPRTPTSSPGAPTPLTDSSAPPTPWSCPSSSISRTSPSYTAPPPCSAPTSPPRVSPPACTRPGSGSPGPATPAGTRTTPSAGPPCASTPSGPRSTTLAARNDRPGTDPRMRPYALSSRKTMTRTVITTENAPSLSAPLSQGIRRGPVLQVSGQLPFDPDTGEVVGTTVAEQTTQTLRNVTAVLKAGGAGLDDVVMLRVYLTDSAHLAEMNQAYAAAVGEPFPARTTVYMQLPPGLLVEVDALAVLGD